jgi:hypothetical protein
MEKEACCENLSGRFISDGNGTPDHPAPILVNTWTALSQLSTVAVRTDYWFRHLQLCNQPWALIMRKSIRLVDVTKRFPGNHLAFRCVCVCVCVYAICIHVKMTQGALRYPFLLPFVISFNEHNVVVPFWNFVHMLLRFIIYLVLLLYKNSSSWQM